jgi:hypothetical protein
MIRDIKLTSFGDRNDVLQYVKEIKAAIILKYENRST